MLPRATGAGLALVAAVLGIGAARVPAERVVVGDGFTAGTLNGVPVRLRIAPGVTGMPAFSLETAAKAGLKRGLFTGVMQVGPVMRAAPTDVARLTIAGRPLKRRVTWLAGIEATGAGADGLIGPAGLPDNVIRFQLRRASAGEQTVALPMAGGGGLLAGDWLPLSALVPLADGTMQVRFDPLLPRSVITAGAGQMLAQAYGGRFADAPQQMAVVLDIQRPVRRLQLARPFPVGPVSLDTLYVRTADFGDASGIPDSSEIADPDEIVVTAHGKRDRRNFRLTLGADVLAACSAIVFDKRAKQIRLTCR